MAIGFLIDDPKISHPTDDRERTANPELDPAPAAHVTGKPTEREPLELASVHEEAPEAASAPEEAPDAGYGRCTESSDWEERGRNWN